MERLAHIGAFPHKLVTKNIFHSVHNLHEAARVLNDWADTALEVANQLLVVAGHVQDRLYEAELWTDAAGSDANVLQGMKDENNYATWWQATSRDAAGRLSGNRFGNGLQTTRNYDRATGQLLNIRTGVAYDQVLVRDLDYEYDALNNLKYRHNNLEQMQEAFEFDELNRLTKSTVTGEVGGSPYSDVINYGYDALGNMTSKDDVGTGSYLYGNAAKSAGGNAGPHAVRDAGGTAYTYDDNGSMLSGGGRSITWTSYNKPASFEKSGDLVTFDYGPERGRFKKTVGTSSQVDETTLYLGKAYERIETASGGVTHKYFIYAGGHLAAVHIQTEDGQGQVDHSQDKTRYMHHGALGSLDTITTEDGTVEEQLFYSPFGAKRNKHWEPLGGTSLYLETNRGFTGHEHIGEMGLIHMNGRVYDPEIGRFLSADPHVQSPHNSQSYNRYSYVFNNPLKYVDPSGYISFSLSDVFKAPFNAFSDLGKSLARTLAKNEVIRTIGQIAAAFFGPEAAAAYAAFITWGTGGSVGDIFKNAVVAYAGAYAFGEVGDALGLPSNPEFLTSGHITAVSVNGVIGGAMSELGGGNFADGFAGAATAQFLGPFVGEIGGGSSAYKIHRVAVSAVVGGTASALGGGKFANGAVSAGFAYLFSNMSAANDDRYEMPTLRELLDEGQLIAEHWPTDHYQITSPYSLGRQHPVLGYARRHTAIDIKNPLGGSVYAVYDGVVVGVGSARGAGNYIKVDHANGVQTSYSHTSSNVNVGDSVAEGQIIGVSDGSGVGTGPHLHFVTRQNGTRVDPCSVITCP